MALAMFERPIYVQQKYFIQEIAGLDDVFELLEEWPSNKQDLTYEVLLGACRKAASGQLPVSAIEENFRRFLKRHGKLAALQEMAIPDRKSLTRSASES